MTLFTSCYQILEIRKIEGKGGLIAPTRDHDDGPGVKRENAPRSRFRKRDVVQTLRPLPNPKQPAKSKENSSKQGITNSKQPDPADSREPRKEQRSKITQPNGATRENVSATTPVLAACKTKELQFPPNRDNQASNLANSEQNLGVKDRSIAQEASQNLKKNLKSSWSEKS